MTVRIGRSARTARGLLALALLAAGAATTGAPAQASAGPAGYAPDVAVAAANTLAANHGLSTAEAMQRLSSQPARIALGERLVDQLGGRTAGFWLDQASDTVVVNVLDAKAAAEVRKAGAVAKVVARSTASLESTRDTLAKLLAAHSSVGIDTAANQVVVRIGSAAVASQGLLETAGALGPAVRVERFHGGYDKLILGGDAIHGRDGGRCSLGFNTTGGTAVTAGHCTAGIGFWYDPGGAFFGPSIAANFPGDDFGLIRNDGGVHQPGEVNLYGGGTQDIHGAADPYQGLSLCKSGSTSYLTCGDVFNTGVTICYAEGCVGDMAETNTRAEPGDSGGSWFAGGTAFGLTSGGGGGLTYFQPVTEALSRYGVWVH